MPGLIPLASEVKSTTRGRGRAGRGRTSLGRSLRPFRNLLETADGGHLSLRPAVPAVGGAARSAPGEAAGRRPNGAEWRERHLRCARRGPARPGEARRLQLLMLQGAEQRRAAPGPVIDSLLKRPAARPRASQASRQNFPHLFYFVLLLSRAPLPLLPRACCCCCYCPRYSKFLSVTDRSGSGHKNLVNVLPVELV